jgi:hypothetical protein
MLLVVEAICDLLSGKIEVAEYCCRNFLKFFKKNYKDEKKDRLQSIYIVIYPYIVSDFIYDLLELDYFKSYCDVEVWDVSLFVTPNFSKKLSMSTSDKKEVFSLSSFTEFFCCVLKLKNRSSDTKVTILNLIPYSSFKELFCNIIVTMILKKNDISIINLHNGGIPLFANDAVYENAIRRFSGLIAKAASLFRKTRSFTEARILAVAIFINMLRRFLTLEPTHRLVAGSDMLAQAQRGGFAKNSVKIVNGHSNDYSNYLRRRSKLKDFEFSQGKIALFLDRPEPMFPSDLIGLGRKVHLTSDIWYPALTKFFDKMEVVAGVKTEIAAHYKAKHPAIAPCFGNRRVYYGRTCELVSESSFVITIASTAISYAVLFRKPVILIYSDQLKHDLQEMSRIKFLATTLGINPINIDDPAIDFSSLLNIDEDKYLKYEQRCLTSTKSLRSNAQIILEDIMNIQCDPS